MYEMNESSLSRVWQHVDSGRPIAILSAFRAKYDQKENIKRNVELATRLQAKNYGYFFVDGAWKEEQDDGSTVDVKEDSIFVVGKEGEEEQFIKDIVELGKRYDQDGVLIKVSGEEGKIYDKEGNVSFGVGELQPGKMADIFIKLRTGKESDTFVFSDEPQKENPKSDVTSALSRMKQLAGTTRE